MRAATLTRFIGRCAEMRRLEEAFAGGARLVTLFGAAGSGKTRLAMTFAERRPCALFFDLSVARCADDLRAVLAEGLGVAPPATGEGDEWIARVGQSFAARGPTLVVVDNCEHLVAAAAAAVGIWCSLAPETNFLVTSRVLLGVPGECAEEVGPLALPRDGKDVEADAFALFLDRARLVRPRYEPTEEDARAIVRLLRALDGLPLAIELAAARIGVLGAPEVLARLPRRFELLTKATLHVGDRHRTLRAAIEWSWDLLAPREQAALAQCAVFKTDFSIHAAEEVLAIGAPVIDAIEALRQSSLLRAVGGAGGEVRFVPYESVRAFAEEKLVAAGERGATEERFIEFFGKLALRAADVRVDDIDARDALVKDDFEHFVAAWHLALETVPVRADAAARIATALVDVLVSHGDFRRLAKMADAAISAMSEPVSPSEGALLANALVVSALAHVNVGEEPPLDADLAKALGLARASGDQALEGRVVSTHGLLRWMLAHDLPAAVSAFERAILLHRSAADVRSEIRTLERLGHALVNLGRSAEARSRLEEGLACARRVSDSPKAAFLLATMGWVLFADGRLPEALACCNEATVYAARCGNERAKALALCYAGPVLQELGRLDEAQEVYGRALLLLRTTFAAPQEAVCRAYFGSLLHERGRFDLARASYVEGLVLLNRAGARLAEGIFHGALAALEATTGDVGSAERELDVAEKRLTESNAVFRDPILDLHRGHVELARARARLREGDFAGARRHRRLAEQADTASSSVASNEDVRFARRLLAAALRTSENQVAFPVDALIIEESAAWFQPPTKGQVSLVQHERLRAVLVALVEQWRARRGKKLGVMDLFQRAWPGEKTIPSAARLRVKVAIARLRDLGLRRFIASDRSGYAIDPGAMVVVAADDEPSPPIVVG